VVPFPLCIAHDPGARLRDIAASLGITERSAHGIVTDLAEAVPEHDLRQRVEVSDDDRMVATAEVSTSEGSGGTARVSVRAEPGHITPGRRASLVDAVLDLPEVQESARVEAAIRLGDGESLHRLQERCEDVRTQSAGWSTLVDANLPPGHAGDHRRDEDDEPDNNDHDAPRWPELGPYAGGPWRPPPRRFRVARIRRGWAGRHVSAV
jgi:hypothetical protein